jgi:hypothetical protein
MLAKAVTRALWSVFVAAAVVGYTMTMLRLAGLGV